MKKMSFEKMASVQGGRWIGTGTLHTCGTCYDGVTICKATFYVLWIPLWSTYSTHAC
jgi:hypothetical protein